MGGILKRNKLNLIASQKTYVNINVKGHMLNSTKPFIVTGNGIIPGVKIGFKICHSLILIRVITKVKVLRFLTKIQLNEKSLKRTNMPNCMNGSLHTEKKEIYKKKLEAEQNKFADLYIQMISTIESKKLYLEPRLTQEDVIRYLGTNRNYLYVALKKYCNTNFKGLLNVYRVRYAQSLLQNKIIDREKYLLSDVYVDCGFSTNESFYRTFKNLTGTSPGKYVEQVETGLS